MAQSTDKGGSNGSTVDLVDALVHFEAARIALRGQFEGSLDLHGGETDPPESVVRAGMPRLTRVGAH
jgi:hypothetical protein